MPRRASAAVTLALGASAAVALALPTVQDNRRDATFRVDVNVVSIYFTVRDAKRRLVPDLAREQFRVFEDRREQSVRFFAHHSDVPLNLGVLIDTRTSLPRILGLEAEAAGEFLQRVLRPTDLAFIVSYDARVRVLQVPTAQVDVLQEKVQSIRRYARTGDLAEPVPQAPPVPWPWPTPSPDPTAGANLLRVARLYDAVEFSVARFLAEEIGRKAVVIVALADDARSESSLEDALRALQQSDVVAYVLQLSHGPRETRDACDVRHAFRTDRPHRLARLAEETGGRVLQVRGMDRLHAAFDEIAEELHSQYSLGYRPLNQSWDGQFRRIQIRTRGKGYRIYARKGYYATPRTSP